MDAANSAPYLNVDGLRLEYRWVQGASPTSPTLVLLHEGLGCVALWRGFPERLAVATGCNVFLWSRAGFGRSDPISLPRPLTYLEREAPLVHDVLRAAGIDDAVLVGHSDGGTIALLAASQEPAPSAIRGIVTLAAHVFVEDITIEGIHETSRSWEEGDLRSRLGRWHESNVDGAFLGWRDTWLNPGFRDWNIQAALSAIHVPVMAIQGADDAYGSPAQVDAIVAGVSGAAEGVLLPGCGHAPHAEQPDAVIAAVDRFLAHLPFG